LRCELRFDIFAELRAGDHSLCAPAVELSLIVQRIRLRRPAQHGRERALAVRPGHSQGPRVDRGPRQCVVRIETELTGPVFGSTISDEQQILVVAIAPPMPGGASQAPFDVDIQGFNEDLGVRQCV